MLNLVVLGGTVAVSCTRNPLDAGLNSFFRIILELHIILVGRHATDPHEPRQVRKEAAISDVVCVVDRSRSCYDSAFPEDSTEGAQSGFTHLKFYLFHQQLSP